MIIDENPTEDAYYYDPYPITIECSLDDEGDDIISNITYDDKALEDERKVEILFKIINFQYGIDDLMKDDEDESYNDVPTFMLSSHKYPEDYTYTCMKCETEFISFSLSYTQARKAIMCPECLSLFWVNHDDGTYRESQEIKEFRAYIAKELESYDNVFFMPIPAKYEPYRKLISYLFEHSLYAPKYLEKNLTKGWGSENECYRAIEELMIEQLRYFLLENTQDYRLKLLRDIHVVRELEKIKNKF
jgi:DNA-directed RNA polymerase subunit RPC12/RpoP